MTHTFPIIRILAVLLALAGCSNDTWRDATNPPETRLSAVTEEKFQPITDITRVFVFPEYSSVGNSAYFQTRAHNISREASERPSYKLYVDGHHVATFSEQQYTEIDLPPGKYLLEVEEIGWLGTSLKKIPTSVSIGGPGQVVFIAIATSAPDMALKTVDIDYGMKSVADREKAPAKQN